jgi:hypothetical protein
MEFKTEMTKHMPYIIDAHTPCMQTLEGIFKKIIDIKEERHIKIAVARSLKHLKPQPEHLKPQSKNQSTQTDECEFPQKAPINMGCLFCEDSKHDECPFCEKAKHVEYPFWENTFSALEEKSPKDLTKEILSMKKDMKEMMRMINVMYECETCEEK